MPALQVLLASVLIHVVACSSDAKIEIGACTISNDGQVNDVHICGTSIASLVRRIEALEAATVSASPLPSHLPPPAPPVYSFVRLVRLAVTAGHMPNTGAVGFYDNTGHRMSAILAAANPSSCRSALESRIAAAAASGGTCNDVGFWWPGNPSCTDAVWDLRASAAPIAAIEIQHVFSGHRGTVHPEPGTPRPPPS